MRRVLVRIAVIIPILAVLLLGGAGWYYSGMVLDPTRGNSYPIEVVSVTGDQVTLRGGADTDAPGTYGLTWAHGNAVLGPVVAAEGGTVTRSVRRVRHGSLVPGVHAYLDRWMWGREDPESAVGVPSTKVSISGYPAWRTEGDSDTWVIAVHGRNADPAEALRVVPVFHKLGMPVLGITYRNDPGTPPTEDGKFHLGDTEWRDVARAIDYARANGAKEVYLYGWSMGGGIVPMTVRRDPALPVKGLILDSPVLDWRGPIQLGAEQRHVPGFLATIGEFVVEHRIGVDFDDLDHVRHAKEFTMPILLFADDDDATVPTAAALEFAKARPDLVTLFRTKGGGHVGSWNVDPGRYEAALRKFVHAG